MPDRVDVHMHMLPDFYRDAIIAAGHSRPDGIARLPEWTESGMIDTMEALGIDHACLSISSPGVHFGDDGAARVLARRVNEESARLRTAYPGRISFFASTPLPDVAGALDEIAHAMDVLGAVGVVFESNFGGVYLGDECLEAVYAELDRRNAILFIHPTSPGTACGCGPHAVPNGLGYPGPMMEFIFDTTRTVTDMVLSGVIERYPNIRIVVPHAGAALPVLVARIDLMGPMLVAAGDAPPPLMRDALRRLHFDLAGAPVPELLAALLSVADHDRIHYGSDYPFTPLPICRDLASKLDETPLLSDDLRRNVMFGNAVRLLQAPDKP